jgi:hypothetical protein
MLHFFALLFLGRRRAGVLAGMSQLGVAVFVVVVLRAVVHHGDAPLEQVPQRLHSVLGAPPARTAR